jgi:DNA-binding Xre family transcriptional regulator
MNNVKKKLKKVMIDKNVLMMNLAKGTGITSVHVSRIVNGQSPGSMEWWKKAAEFLGVELSEIIE